MKHVWIINHYAPFQDKDGWVGLHLEMAEELAGGRWNVVVVAASTSHPGGRQFLRRGENRRLVRWNSAEAVWVRSSPYSGNGLGRIRNMAEFGLRLMLRGTTKDLPAPDVVVAGGVVNPIAALASAKLAQRLGAPFVLEISDIWPDTLVQLGKLSSESLAANSLGALERWLISTADAVMSPLARIDKYLVKKGFSDVPFYWVPNGVSGKQPLPRANGSRFGKNPFTFMYLGSLGHANAVDSILKAFSRFVTAEGGDTVRLEIVGAGPLREDLMIQAMQLGIAHQVVWTDRIARDRVLEYLFKADALIANMRDLHLYQYGIALNKLFDYLLSARPVIFASNAEGNIVEEAGAGITVQADNIDQMAAAMQTMLHLDPKSLDQWGEAGRRYILDGFTYRHSAARFESMLNEILEMKNDR